MERIYGFRDEHFFLSNFFVESDGLTGEHRFQAAKTSDPIWRERILGAPTPGKAKYFGRSVPLRGDWEDVKIDVMRKVVTDKFCNPGLAKLLLGTGDATLVEANIWHDMFWGVDEKSGTGSNHLGLILMEVRDRLRAADAEPSVSAESGYVTAATDGSAAPNPGPAGWSWYVNEDCWAAGAAPHSTNNRAELAAMLNLFRATAADFIRLHILCDSRYVIGALSGNKANKNADLIGKLRAAAAGRDYTIEWVRGHNGNPLNEAVDGKCTAASAAVGAGLEIPVGPGWTGAASIKTQGDTQ